MADVSITLRVDADCEGVCVEPVGPQLFRLHDTPIIANWEEDRVWAWDVIEVELLADGTHALVRVVERSPMHHFDFMIPRAFYESPDYARFGDAVVAAGGRWEGVLGGLLLVHLPPDSAFDPWAELSLRMEASRESAPDA